MTRRLLHLSLARVREQIESSSLKGSSVWIVLGILVTILIFAGWELGDRYGLLIGFFSSLALVAWVLFFADWRMEQIFPGNIIEGQDAWGLRNATRLLSRQISTPMPALFVVKSETPFALSAGISPETSRLFVSQGLLEKFSTTQVQLVVLYELNRIQTGYTRRATVAVALASLISSFAGTIDTVFLKLFGGRRKVQGPLTILTSPLVALWTRWGNPNRGIYGIDRKLADTKESARSWSEVLLKLESYNKTLPIDVALPEASLFTVSPLARVKSLKFAVPQPTAEARAARLVGRFPL